MVLIFWLVVIFAIFLLIAWNLNAQAANRAVLFASLLGTAGWLITVHATRANERRKVTIDLVLRHQMDRAFEDHKHRVLRRFPPFTMVDTAAAEILDQEYRAWQLGTATDASDQRPPVGYSIVQILNFYEFIAVSVRRARLDEGVAFDSFAAISRNMVRKFGAVIRLFRTAGTPGYGSNNFCHLAWLMKRWHGIDIDKADAEAALTDPVGPESSSIAQTATSGAQAATQ